MADNKAKAIRGESVSDLERRQIVCYFAEGWTIDKICRELRRHERAVRNVILDEKWRETVQLSYTALKKRYPKISNYKAIKDILTGHEEERENQGTPIGKGTLDLDGKTIGRIINSSDSEVLLKLASVRYTGLDREGLLARCYLPLTSDLDKLIQRKNWPVCEIKVVVSESSIQVDDEDDGDENQLAEDDLNDRRAKENMLALHWDQKVLDWSAKWSTWLAQKISKNEMIGISWGRQMRAIVDALRDRADKSKATLNSFDNFQCVPLCGMRHHLWRTEVDAYVSEPEKLLPFALSRDLERVVVPFERLNGLSDPEVQISWPDLLGISKYPFSEELSDSELVEEERLFRAFKQHINALTPSGGLYAKLEKIGLMIVGLGSPSGFASSRAGASSYAGVPAEWFKNNVIGDLGGVLLPRPELESTDPGFGTKLAKVQWRRIQNSWAGMTLEQIRSVADRHRKNESGGVLAVGVGKAKAGACLESVRRGLVNHVVIDQTLANALHKLVKAELKH